MLITSVKTIKKILEMKFDGNKVRSAVL